jgi:hypothetical protein
MRQHPNICKSIKWGGAAVTVGRWLAPWWLFAAFVGASFVWLKSKSPVVSLTLFASAPYVILGAGAAFSRLCVSPERGPLWTAIPAILIAVYHGWLLSGYVHDPDYPTPRPGSELYFSADQATGISYILSGAFFSFLALLWLVLIFWKPRLRPWRVRDDRLCPKCDYGRTGLAAGAVCPECGEDAA